MNGAQVGWLDHNLSYYAQNGRLDSDNLLAFAGYLEMEPVMVGAEQVAEQLQALAMDKPGRTWRVESVRRKVLEMYRDSAEVLH